MTSSMDEVLGNLTVETPIQQLQCELVKLQKLLLLTSAGSCLEPVQRVAALLGEHQDARVLKQCVSLVHAISASPSHHAAIVRYCLPLLWQILMRQRSGPTQAAFSAVRVLRSRLSDDLRAAACKQLLLEVRSSYCGRFSQMMRDPVMVQHALVVWALLVEFLGAHLQDTRSINALLRSMEIAMKQADTALRREAVRVWGALVDNFLLTAGLHANVKRLRLLVVPLASPSARSPELLQVRVEVWWRLVCGLGVHLPDVFQHVVVPLLHTCFGPAPGETAAVRTDPQTLSGWPELHPLARGVLVLLLEPLSRPQLTGAAASLLAAPGASVLRPDVLVAHGSLLVHAVVSCLTRMPVERLPQLTLRPLCEALLAPLTATQSPPSSPEKQHQLSATTALLVSRLPAEFLSSNAHHMDGDVLLGSPALYLLHQICSTPWRLWLPAEQLQERDTLRQLLATLDRPLLSQLRAVVQLLRSQLSGNHESLPAVWCYLANRLKREVEQTQEVDAGDALEHDFDPVLDTLCLPLTAAAAAVANSCAWRRRWTAAWTALYARLAPAAELVATAPSNALPSALCTRLLQLLPDTSVCDAAVLSATAAAQAYCLLEATRHAQLKYASTVEAHRTATSGHDSPGTASRRATSSSTPPAASMLGLQPLFELLQRLCALPVQLVAVADTPAAAAEDAGRTVECLAETVSLLSAGIQVRPAVLKAVVPALCTAMRHLIVKTGLSQLPSTRDKVMHGYDALAAALGHWVVPAAVRCVVDSSAQLLLAAPEAAASRRLWFQVLAPRRPAVLPAGLEAIVSGMRPPLTDGSVSPARTSAPDGGPSTPGGSTFVPRRILAALSAERDKQRERSATPGSVSAAVVSSPGSAAAAGVTTPRRPPPVAAAAAGHTPVVQPADRKNEVFFVPKSSGVKRRQGPLTDHQRERLTSRRDDIPALYADLSQDTQQLFNAAAADSQSAESQPSAVAGNAALSFSPAQSVAGGVAAAPPAAGSGSADQCRTGQRHQVVSGVDDNASDVVDGGAGSDGCAADSGGSVARQAQAALVATSGAAKSIGKGKSPRRSVGLSRVGQGVGGSEAAADARTEGASSMDRMSADWQDLEGRQDEDEQHEISVTKSEALNQKTDAVDPGKLALKRSSGTTKCADSGCVDPTGNEERSRRSPRKSPSASGSLQTSTTPICKRHLTFAGVAFRSTEDELASVVDLSESEPSEQRDTLPSNRPPNISVSGQEQEQNEIGAVDAITKSNSRSSKTSGAKPRRGRGRSTRGTEQSVIKGSTDDGLPESDRTDELLSARTPGDQPSDETTAGARHASRKRRISLTSAVAPAVSGRASKRLSLSSAVGVESQQASAKPRRRISCINLGGSSTMSSKSWQTAPTGTVEDIEAADDAGLVSPDVSELFLKPSNGKVEHRTSDDVFVSPDVADISNLKTTKVSKGAVGVTVDSGSRKLSASEELTNDDVHNRSNGGSVSLSSSEGAAVASAGADTPERPAEGVVKTEDTKRASTKPQTNSDADPPTRSRKRKSFVVSMKSLDEVDVNASKPCSDKSSVIHAVDADQHRRILSSDDAPPTPLESEVHDTAGVGMAFAASSNGDSQECPVKSQEVPDGSERTDDSKLSAKTPKHGTKTILKGGSCAIRRRKSLGPNVKIKGQVGLNVSKSVCRDDPNCSPAANEDQQRRGPRNQAEKEVTTGIMSPSDDLPLAAHRRLTEDVPDRPVRNKRRKSLAANMKIKENGGLIKSKVIPDAPPLDSAVGGHADGVADAVTARVCASDAGTSICAVEKLSLKGEPEEDDEDTQFLDYESQGLKQTGSGASSLDVKEGSDAKLSAATDRSGSGESAVEPSASDQIASKRAVPKLEVPLESPPKPSDTACFGESRLRKRVALSPRVAAFFKRTHRRRSLAVESSTDLERRPVNRRKSIPVKLPYNEDEQMVKRDPSEGGLVSPVELASPSRAERVMNQVGSPVSSLACRDKRLSMLSLIPKRSPGVSSRTRRRKRMSVADMSARSLLCSSPPEVQPAISKSLSEGGCEPLLSSTMESGAAAVSADPAERWSQTESAPADLGSSDQVAVDGPASGGSKTKTVRQYTKRSRRKSCVPSLPSAMTQEADRTSHSFPDGSGVAVEVVSKGADGLITAKVLDCEDVCSDVDLPKQCEEIQSDQFSSMMRTYRDSDAGCLPLKVVLENCQRANPQSRKMSSKFGISQLSSSEDKVPVVSIMSDAKSLNIASKVHFSTMSLSAETSTRPTGGLAVSPKKCHARRKSVAGNFASSMARSILEEVPSGVVSSVGNGGLCETGGDEGDVTSVAMPGNKRPKDVVKSCSQRRKSLAVFRFRSAPPVGERDASVVNQLVNSSGQPTGDITRCESASSRQEENAVAEDVPISVNGGSQSVEDGVQIHQDSSVDSDQRVMSVVDHCYAQSQTVYDADHVVDQQADEQPDVLDVQFVEDGKSPDDAVAEDVPTHEEGTLGKDVCTDVESKINEESPETIAEVEAVEPTNHEVLVSQSGENSDLLESKQAESKASGSPALVSAESLPSMEGETAVTYGRDSPTSDIANDPDQAENKSLVEHANLQPLGNASTELRGDSIVVDQAETSSETDKPALETELVADSEELFVSPDVRQRTPSQMTGSRAEMLIGLARQRGADSEKCRTGSAGGPDSVTCSPVGRSVSAQPTTDLSADNSRCPVETNDVVSPQLSDGESSAHRETASSIFDDRTPKKVRRRLSGIKSAQFEVRSESPLRRRIQAALDDGGQSQSLLVKPVLVEDVVETMAAPTIGDSPARRGLKRRCDDDVVPTACPSVVGSPLQMERPAWVRHIYSPSASPSASILKKRKRRLSADPTTSPVSTKKRVVQFADPPVSASVEIPPVGSRRCAGARRRSAPSAVGRRPRPLAALAEFQPSSPAAVAGVTCISPSPVCQELTACARLAGCVDDVSCLVERLTSSTWRAGLCRLLASHGIRTVGQLAVATPSTLAALPVRSPRLQTVRDALLQHADSRHKRSPSKTEPARLGVPICTADPSCEGHTPDGSSSTEGTASTSSVSTSPVADAEDVETECPLPDEDREGAACRISDAVLSQTPVCGEVSQLEVRKEVAVAGEEDVVMTMGVTAAVLSPVGVTSPTDVSPVSVTSHTDVSPVGVTSVTGVSPTDVMGAAPSPPGVTVDPVPSPDTVTTDTVASPDATTSVTIPLTDSLTTDTVPSPPATTSVTDSVITDTVPPPPATTSVTDSVTTDTVPSPDSVITDTALSPSAVTTGTDKSPLGVSVGIQTDPPTSDQLRHLLAAAGADQLQSLFHMFINSLNNPSHQH